MFTQRKVSNEAIEVASPLTGEIVWVGYYPDLFDNNYKLNLNCELVRVYPELLDIKIIVQEGGGSSYYHTIKKEIVLYVNNNKKEVGATLTHEVQHAIQAIDGRACGASSSRYYYTANYFYGDKNAAEMLSKSATLYLLNKEERELYKLAEQVLNNHGELEKYYNKDKMWLHKLSANCYLASVGEIEARTAGQIYLNKGTNFNLVEDYNSGYLNAQLVRSTTINFLSEEFKFDTSLNDKFYKLATILAKRKQEHMLYLASFKVNNEKQQIGALPLEDSLDLIEEHYLNKFGEESHQRMQRPRTNYTKVIKPAKA